MSAPDYPVDSWLRVAVDGMAYNGQVRSCDGAGVVVNIPGLGQRRVKHAQVVGPVEAPADPLVASVPEVPSEREPSSPEAVPPATSESETATEEVITLPRSSVEPFARNPRQFRKLENGTVDPDQHGLRQLAESLRTLGQQQPVIVRRLEDGRYGLVDGERRFHALGLAEISTIRVVVKQMTDEEALAATVAASNLSEPYGIRDRARAVSWLLSGGRTQTQVAELLGTDQGAVSILQRVFALPGPVQELIDQGKLRFGHVRHLVRDHLLQHPKILTRIAEIAAARDARVAELAPEIPFEGELPIEMVRALRPQERLVLEETLSPSEAEAQNAAQSPQDTVGNPHSKTETRTETTTETAPEPPATFIDEEQLAWRKGRAAALRNLPFAPPEDLTAQWIAGWETVRPAPVDPKKQPVKTAAQIAADKPAQTAAPAAASKPGALKTAEEKVAEQKGGKPGETRTSETRTSALIPNTLVDRLAGLGGTVVTALEDWCKLASITGPYELEPSAALDYLNRFLDACCECEVDPDAAIADIHRDLDTSSISVQDLGNGVAQALVPPIVEASHAAA